MSPQKSSPFFNFLQKGPEYTPPAKTIRPAGAAPAGRSLPYDGTIGLAARGKPPDQPFAALRGARPQRPVTPQPPTACRLQPPASSPRRANPIGGPFGRHPPEPFPQTMAARHPAALTQAAQSPSSSSPCPRCGKRCAGRAPPPFSSAPRAAPCPSSARRTAPEWGAAPRPRPRPPPS